MQSIHSIARLFARPASMWRRLEPRSLAFAVLLATLSAAAICGCGLDDEAADFSFLNTEPETLDPSRIAGQAGFRIVLNLFEGLTTRELPSLRPVPGAAARWSVSDDGRTWRFHLRSSRWSDGEPLTSRHFRYAWTRLLQPETASEYASLLFPVKNARRFNAGSLVEADSLGLSCPDDSTFVVQLESPVPYFLDLCALPLLVPLPEHAIERWGDGWIRPGRLVGNGAYMLEDWQINRRIRLRRNPLYRDAERVELEVVDVFPGDFINGNFNRYTSGLLDWIDASGIPLSIVDVLREREDWHAGPFLSTYFLRLNVRRPPLDDARVRRALYHAVDAGKIVDYVTRGGQVAAHSLVPPGLPGYEEVRLDGFQPERAAELLAEAGYSRGEGFPELTLMFNTSEAHRQIAEVLQQQWREVLGIRVQLRNQEWKVFTATVQEGDYDIARGSWIGDYLDPSTFLDIWTSGNGNNRTGFTSAAYDSLIESAQFTIDPGQRMATLRRCEEIVTRDECIIVPIYYYVVTNMYDGTRWEGLEPNLVNHVDLKSVRRRPGAP